LFWNSPNPSNIKNSRERLAEPICDSGQFCCHQKRTMGLLSWNAVFCSRELGKGEKGICGTYSELWHKTIDILGNKFSTVYNIIENF
jgi:hypothetical protein